jgi:hypothetical protein
MLFNKKRGMFEFSILRQMRQGQGMQMLNREVQRMCFDAVLKYGTMPELNI